MGVFLQQDAGGDSRGLEGLGCITDAADFNGGVGIADAKDEISVQAGGGTVCGTCLHDRGSDYGAHCVLNHAFNLVSALGEYCSSYCKQQCYGS